MDEAIGEGFVDHQSGIANARTLSPTLPSGGPMEAKGAKATGIREGGGRAGARDYLTSFNAAAVPRPWPCGDFGSCNVFGGTATAVSASHNAFNSRSAT
jgi:hypothetical protein